MNKRKLFEGAQIAPMGLGCWAIGGPFTYYDGTPVGWGEVDDKESIRAIHAGIEAGINYFDTAQVYGTGHSEEVLGEALQNRPDILISSKVGRSMDRQKRQMIADTSDPKAIAQSIEQSMKRLKRSHIDMIYLHVGDFSIVQAQDVFQCLEDMRVAGKIRAYGWSTDLADRAESFRDRKGFQSVQLAMNVFEPATDVLAATERSGRSAVVRSPLAMGMLSGKFTASQQLDAADVRAQNLAWLKWFEDGRVAPRYARQLSEIRELLMTSGRTLVQGALGWIWAKSPATIPIPGFRTEQQVRELAGAMRHGPIDQAIVAEIDARLASGQPLAATG
jgi:aryl-alcohol dehydrogenase-like predicted oxidoreductase